MATNNRNLMVIARNSDFQDRVSYAMMNAAIAVMAEAAITANHALRVAYAKSIINNTANVLQMTVGVLNNATIAAEAVISVTLDAGFAIPDSDIQFAVNSNFNAFAGVAN